MSDKVLILLQENSGKVPLPSSVPSELESIIYSIIDSLVENTENVVRSLQGSIHYVSVILLTDADCTRDKLLNELVRQTKKGRIIDLIILGHGGDESLSLHNESLSGGTSGSIRRLRSDAVNLGCSSINLRMVSMCNCVASSVNDDWLYVGADVSIGAKNNNYMPEPMMTFFIHNWLSGMKAKDAAKKAYEATIPFFSVIYLPTVTPRYRTQTIDFPCGLEGFPPRVKFCSQEVSIPDGVSYIENSKIGDSKLVVAGNRECRF